MNAPDRFELFIMGDGEEKVTAVDETRVPNCVTFTFNKEDHTLGNLLRSQLLKDPKVLFAGYKVPHPLFPSFELRVQTTDETNPRAAVIKAAQDLIKDLTIFRNNFTREWELKKMIDPAKEGN
ncbi:DNA-directed RNA polymerase II core subunit [Arthrobotrys conoides]|uniref:DNA-directed RNA polymerase II core subunit n=1 Tax=Arthrobotrys conoides TaxID=74498 RepID=A0AAN8RTY9_9PEZI